MSKYSTLLYKIYNQLAAIPSKISWSRRRRINEADKAAIARQLASGYYIILTGSTDHLSSIIVSFLSWFTTGRWAKYTHVLMNCDNIEDPSDRDKFKFVEATGVGVHYSTFDQVFDCDYVCLLTPTNTSNEEWTEVVDNLLTQIGKPYDDLFDLLDSTHVSCVELILNGLKNTDFENDFENLADMIQQRGNLVPEMFRDCEDFVIASEY